MNNRIFVDMDGTLVGYNKEATLDDYMSEGYFESLLPNYSVLNAIKILIGLGYDVYILSAVYIETTAAAEKTAWLHRYLPEIFDTYEDKHVIFTPCGKDKIDYIDNPSPSDVLLDDYSKNLIPWSFRAIGIKCVNSINWNNGTWYGYSVNVKSDAAFIANTIRGILQIENEKIA